MKKEFKPLSDNEIVEINNAITEAEISTSAEIVPVLVKKVKSDKSAIQFQMKCLHFISFLCFATAIYTGLTQTDLVLTSGLLLIVILFEYFVSTIEKKIPAITKNAVLQEAENEYKKSGVGETLMSNGVLLFISLEDKQVVILADEDLRLSFDDARWIDIVKNFQSNIKYISLKDAIIKSIKELGIICKESCPKVAHDLNEIKNEIRIKE